MGKIRYDKVYPLPAYDGPQPVYTARPQWAGARACYVRRNGKVWETAVLLETTLHNARFSACPTASASFTRHAAVMAFDYFHNRL